MALWVCSASNHRPGFEPLAHHLGAAQHGVGDGHEDGAHMVERVPDEVDTSIAVAACTRTG